MVTGQGGRDGADLLVAGGEQEGRGPAVGLHAHDVEVLLRVGQQPGAVRLNGAAGVEFGVDQRTELTRGFDSRVQFQPEFPEDVQIGAEAGGRNHDVGLEGAAIRGGQGDGAVGRGEGGDPEPGVKFDGAGLDEAAEPAAELAAGGEPIGVASP